MKDTRCILLELYGISAINNYLTNKFKELQKC